MKQESQPKTPIWKKKIPLNSFLIILVILSAAIFFASKLFMTEHSSTTVESALPAPAPTPSNVSQVMLKKDSSSLTKRLLFAFVKTESPSFSPVKNKIKEYIQQEKQKQSFTDISVYLLRQNSGDWMGINPEDSFSSTGYIRLAILITYLKEAERTPAVLEKKLWYQPANPYQPENNNSVALMPGKNYAVKELLKYMMASEDSNAKWLLANNLKTEQIEKVFTDLGMAKPDLRHRKFSINVQEYSRFLQVLYNATYLSPSASEFALQLLANDNDKSGMLRKLPPDVKALHRIGKRCIAADCDFRESGIIYAGSEPYILTVFAKGSNTNQLENITGEISKLVFDNVSGTR